MALLRARAVTQPSETARLEAEADAAEAARAAGVSQWGSELSADFLAGAKAPGVGACRVWHHTCHVLHMEQHPCRVVSYAGATTLEGGDGGEDGSRA